jgi:integrase
VIVTKLPRGVRIHNGYVEARLQHHGKSIVKHFGAESDRAVKAAKIWVQSTKLKISLNQYSPEDLEHRLSIPDACDTYLKLHGPSLQGGFNGRNYHNLRRVLKQIKAAWATRMLDTISPLDVRDFRALYKSPGTRNRYHTVITSMFARFEDWNEDGNVIRRVKLPKKNPGSKWPKEDERPYIRKRVLSPEEWDRFSTAASARCLRCCEWLLSSSLRVGDAKKNIADGVQGKTGGAFSIPFDAPADLDWTNFRTDFYEAKKAANIKDFTPRDLRRTGPTWMMRDGTPLPVLQKILGHADIRTTQRYLHVNESDTTNAREKLKTRFKLGGKVGGTALENQVENVAKHVDNQ